MRSDGLIPVINSESVGQSLQQLKETNWRKKMDTDKKTKIAQNRLKIKNSLKAAVKASTLDNFINTAISHQIKNGLSTLSPSTLESFKSSSSIQSQNNVETFEKLFEMGKKIGAGSQSIVHQCLEKSTGKKYAVKVIKKYSEQIIQGIEETFALMRELNHPNIIQVSKLFIQRGTRKILIITELCQFKDLRDYLNSLKAQEARMSEKQIIEFLRKLLDVLSYLKQKRICHRDIKPENILYNPKTGEIKLIDFEISRKNKNPEDKMDLWSDIGSIHFRAPESFKGGYDERVDMWATGVILYEMLTSSLPFFSEYRCEAKEKILKEKLNFDQIQASDRLVSLLRNLLEKDANLRATPNESICYLTLNAQQKMISGVTTTHSDDSEEKDTTKNLRELEIMACLIKKLRIRKRSSSIY